MSKNIYKILSESKEKRKFYIKRYIKFIESRKNRILTEETYTEVHHIVPKSWGGDNSKENLIKLTAREHFIAHLILSHTDDNKMIYAFWQMSNGCNYIDYRISSTTYEKIKEKFSLNHSASMIGNRNHFYGKRHSEKSKKLVSEANKGRIFTEETRKLWSDQRKGHKPFNFKKVICVETGRVFESGAEACRFLGLGRGEVCNAIHKSQRAGNYHWKYF